MRNIGLMQSSAKDILARFLDPMPYDRFFEEFVGRKAVHLADGDLAARAAIIGDDPGSTILNAYEAFSPKLTCHSGSAKVAPPNPRRVGSAQEFHDLIREYHQAQYTVRIPETAGLSPRLQSLCRAFEVLFETPASAGIFWSAAGADAPVHHDEVDLVVIQLTGNKRWFVSADPPTLPNTWKTAGEGAPALERHHVIDVKPGDLIYMPRGTAHTVTSTTESIHAFIGFMPVTVREAMAAAVDYLSELDRSIRAGITTRADELSRGEGMPQVFEQVRRGLEDLLGKCRSDEFISEAISRRRARMIEDLPRLRKNPSGEQITPRSRVRHTSLAVAHVLATDNVVDFRQPGERILVHRGAEEALRYIVDKREFRVADLPGPLNDDVKVALVSRLVTSGFLEPATEQ